MNQLMKTVVSLSVSGSILMSALFLVRRLSKSRTSKTWRYYIWLIILIRFLIPFTPEISVVGSLFEKTMTYEIDKSSDAAAGKPLEAAVLEPSKEEGQSLEGEGLTPFSWQDVIRVFLYNPWIIWLGVLLIILVRKITVYQSFVKYVRAGSTPVTDIGILEKLGIIAGRQRLKAAVELYENSLISSPILIGFFKPCIIIPSADIEVSDFDSIIVHELTHYKRKDLFYKWLVQITICIHWFNPFVYIMDRCISRDCELSCDEAVIRSLRPRERLAYGDALLNAAGWGTYKNYLASTALNESRELLQERLECIMKYKKLPRFAALLSLLLTVLLLGGCTYLGAFPYNNLDRSEKRKAGTFVNNEKTDEMDYVVIHGKKYYNIYNEAQLRSIGSSKESLGRRYLLQSDIWLTGEWEPVGTEALPFTGVFNGNGCAVYGLTITDPDADIVGMFGYARGAVFHNIELVDVDISSAGRNISDKKVDFICAVSVECQISEDIWVTEKDNTAENEAVEMEKVKIKGKTWYLVSNETQLRSIGLEGFGLDKNYLQNNDIYLSADDWAPIGDFDKPFTGAYNGNGYEINGLTIRNPDAKIAGLFGAASGAELYNIIMRDYDISSAGKHVSGKGIAPVVVYGLEGTKSYDNHVYPK